MRAHRIIEGAAFGPEVLRAASEAFDAAWHKIADRFDATMHESARDLLATAIISAARNDSADPEALRRTGISAMIRAYPKQFAPPSPDGLSQAADTPEYGQADYKKPRKRD